MCGIAGIARGREPVDLDALRRMVECLAHRGPDGGGIVERGSVALGHRRLAVIDLSNAGLQPMADGDERVWITFNGEIYNFRELRAELERKSVRFRTQTDTEVILEAYKAWDLAFLERLNGMFAFAIWDEPRRRLLLARDRLGEKPLFYQDLADGGLVFASELKALRKHPAVDREISPAALSQFLTLGYVLGSDCILAGAKKLPAGHALLIEEGKPRRIWSFWDLARAFHNKSRFRSEAEAGEALDAAILEAVRSRSISDAPLGAFLSGGVDSAIVVAAMTRLHEREVRTFTLGFEQGEFDETQAARQTAQALGSTHLEERVASDVAGALPKIARATDEPFSDTSIVPTYGLCRFAREHTTVCLSGDGGDELFAGYVTYAADRLRHLTAWLPAPITGGAAAALEGVLPARFGKVTFDYKLRRFLEGHGRGADAAHWSWREIAPRSVKRRLVQPQWREAFASIPDPRDAYAAHVAQVEDCHYLDRAMYVDLKTWLTDDILVKVDQASMAHSLEVRPPFLDHRLVEFAASLPVDMKLKGFRGKHLLKESQRRHLPPGTLERRKRGFNAPVALWMEGELHDLARASMSTPAMGRIFEPAALEQIWNEHSTRRRDWGYLLFGLTCLGLWLT